jgi:hypothetical protein
LGEIEPVVMSVIYAQGKEELAKMDYIQRPELPDRLLGDIETERGIGGIRSFEVVARVEGARLVKRDQAMTGEEECEYDQYTSIYPTPLNGHGGSECCGWRPLARALMATPVTRDLWRVGGVTLRCSRAASSLATCLWPTGTDEVHAWWMAWARS